MLLVSGQNTPNKKIMVEFSSIIDTDLGCLHYVHEHYNNPKYINQDVWECDFDTIRTDLLNREDPNPISIAVIQNDNAKQVQDLLYKTILDTNNPDIYSKVLEHSTITSVATVLHYMIETNSQYQIEVLCNASVATLEKDLLSRFAPELTSRIITTPKDQVNLKDYDTVIIRNLSSTSDYANPEKIFGVNIICMGYAYNLQYLQEYGEWIPNIKHTNLIPKNTVSYMDVYSDKDKIKLEKKEVPNNE